MIKKISDTDFEWIRKKVNNKVALDIEEFIQSEETACEVISDDYKSVESARNAYKVAAKRCGYAVEFTVAKNRLFMFRKEV